MRGRPRKRSSGRRVLSHVPESGAHLSVYRPWLDEQDFAPAYAYLHRMLRFLQWQKRQSGLAAQRWVLKSPAHLGYLDLLRAQFEDLHIAHMHRDPRTTIASGASLNATVHAMHADTVDLPRVGVQRLDRMGWTNDRAMAVRERWADDGARVTDIAFDDAVADPVGQVARVYDAIGLPLTAGRKARCDAGWPSVPAKRHARPTVWKTTACVRSRSMSGSRCTTSIFVSTFRRVDG